jgi:tRNA dimethylallyltransferase
MLYFRALLSGLSTLPSADAAIRTRLEAEAEVEGWASLHRRLADVDAAAAARIHPNDPQRIQRALEVYELTGVPLSELQQQQQVDQPLPYRIIKLAVAPAERSVLHQRITQRFEQMLGEGLVEEVESLRQRGDLHLDLPALRAVGYRQVWEFLDGDIDYTEMVERGIIATRQLAKRQFTWLRSEPSLTLLDSLDGRLKDKALKYLDGALM